MESLKERRLWEVIIVTYAFAEDEESAIEAVWCQLNSDTASATAEEAFGIDKEWQSSIPFGETNGRTCTEILALQKIADEIEADDDIELENDLRQMTIDEA